MKIARIIGAEDVRNVQMPGHAGAAQMIPFAESFNESMSGVGSMPGGLQRESLDGDVTLQGNEEVKRDSKEGPSMAHLLSGVSAEISAGSKKGLSKDGAGVSGSRGTSPGEETVHKDPSTEASQLSGTQQKDVSVAGEDSVHTDNVPPVSAGLKETLMADLPQGVFEKVPEAKEDHRPKETIKIHQEGVQRKASKKEEAVGVMATASAAEMPVTTEMNASVATAPPVSIATLPIPAKDLLEAGDGSFSASIDAPKFGRETRGTQTTQKNASQVSLESAKTNGDSKQSVDQSLSEAVTESMKSETRSPGDLKNNEGASIASPLSEKSHSLSMDNAFNVASTEALMHGQGQPISQPEKAAPVHAVPADTQPGATPMTPQIFGTDAHKILAASPTSLEVGVPGGTHGWLKVRAELTGDGVVHASVSSSSLAGTEMLRRELPSLTSYLHQEQLPVSSIVVHASSSMDDRNFARGGQGQDPGQGATDSQGDARQERGTVYQGEDAIFSGISNEMEGQDSPLSAGYASGGGWLSVRA